MEDKSNYMKYIFVGNIIDYDSNNIGGRSIPQNQALNYQKNFILGLIANLNPKDVNIVGLPLFGSFMVSESSLYYKQTEDYFEDVKMFRPFFINLPILKWFYWFVFIRRLINRIIKLNPNETLNVIFYSFENGFLFYPLLLRKINEIILSIIITDIPDYINSRIERPLKQGLIYNSYRSLFCRFDKYVYITQEINDFLNKPSSDYVVIDGYIDSIIKSRNLSTRSRKKSIVYAGTLDRKYGIDIIIELSKLLVNERVEFLIFGYTKSEYLLAEFDKLPNLTFYGYLELTILKKYYENADAFIIPRPLGLVNNKYSNPSKLYEYLSYCKSVFLNDLPSIPSNLKSILKINKNKEFPVKGFYEIILDFLHGASNMPTNNVSLDDWMPSNQVKRYIKIL
jgi:hypothetical protein